MISAQSAPTPESMAGIAMAEARQPCAHAIAILAIERLGNHDLPPTEHDRTLNHLPIHERHRQP
jgi:hypothetical protein